MSKERVNKEKAVEVLRKACQISNLMDEIVALTFKDHHDTQEYEMSINELLWAGERSPFGESLDEVALKVGVWAEAMAEKAGIDLGKVDLHG